MVRYFLTVGGPAMWVVLVLALAQLGLTVRFAIRPEDRLRAAASCLTKATVFACVAAFSANLAVASLAIAGRPELRVALAENLLTATGEALAPLVVGLALLSVAHVVLAIGERWGRPES